MKIDRLIGIITILLQQEKATAPELASQFQVSRRTINRDVEALCMAGIPLVTAQGYGGGISIAEGYKLDKSILTQEELQSVLAGLDGIDRVSKETYFTKLLEKFSSRNNRLLVDDVILIDLTSHSQPSLARKIEVIKKMILENHLIAFHYYEEEGESQRLLEPYRLVFRDSFWYVFGYCREEGAFCFFRLDRLARLRDVGEIFLVRDMPESELADCAGEEPFYLQAVFEAGEKYHLVESYGEDSFSVLEDGSLLFEYDCTDHRTVMRWILGFGGKVEVLKPEWLREELHRQAKRMEKRYGESGERLSLRTVP